MTSAEPSERDHAAAAAVTEMFGSYWADRPNQFVGLMGLAKVAALAMEGDTNARQAILDGTVESMLGINGKQAVRMTGAALSVFLSAAAGPLDPAGNSDPSTSATDALEWADRWERWTYSR